MGELQAELRRLSGTTLDAQGAANAWAGTTGLDLLGALNAKAGTSGKGLLAVLNQLAGTTGLDANAAAGAISGSATYTIFGSTADGYLNGPPGGLDNTGVGADTTGDVYVGQQAGVAYQSFVQFDTSSVVGTVTAATLSLYGTTDASTTDFTVEARLYDWGATLDSTDWVPYTTMAAKTLLATLSTVGFNAAGYNAFTSDPAFVSNINKAGFTRIGLFSSRQRTQATITGQEYVGFKSADTAGTAQDPKLVVVAG